jgi:hypothetical protein
LTNGRHHHAWRHFGNSLKKDILKTGTIELDYIGVTVADSDLPIFYQAYQRKIDETSNDKTTPWL